jgi:hypothetical protein
MANQLKKPNGEPHLYFREVSAAGKRERMLYIRKTDGNGTDTHVCLNTTRVGIASLNRSKNRRPH